MLIKSLQKVLNVRERAVLLRFYFTGSNVHYNLQSRVSVQRNPHSSLVKNLILECRRQEWAVDIAKRGKTILRLCHTRSNEVDKITENKFAHLILERRGIKHLAIAIEVNANVTEENVESILNNEWKDSSPEDTLHAFETLSFYAKSNSLKLNDEKYVPILEALCHKLVDLDDDKFRRVFQCLELWADKGSIRQWPPYVKLWMELDTQCHKRFNHWTAKEALLACDYLSNLYLTKKTKFPIQVLKKLGRKPNKMSTDTLLTFLYMINTCRKAPMNMYEIEYRVQGILHEFTADELGIVAMSFFKTQTPIRNPTIVHEILFKLLQEIETVGDVSISAIMKITRYSKSLREVDLFKRVLIALQSRVPDLTIACLTNVMHAAAYFQTFVPETMDLITDKMTRVIDTTRIKDLERFSWSLVIFDYNPESKILQSLTKNLSNPKRKLEFEEFPKSSSTMLSHLSQIGIFPLDIIKQHFDPSFIQKCYDNNPYKMGYNYFMLENNLKIDVPEYDGPFLKPSIRDFLAKKFLASEFEPSNIVRSANQFQLEVTHVCKSIFERDTSVYVDQVLPHYVKPDIIIALDDNNEPIDPQPLLSQIPTSTIKYPSQVGVDLKWIAVVLATQNQMIKETNKYVGPLVCKVRQLEKIGYTPIVVPYNVWYTLQELSCKETYLKKHLFGAIDHKTTVAAL